MPNVDAFISSPASGSTSPTASPPLIMTVHIESSTNLLLGFQLNGRVSVFCHAHKVSMFCLTYCRAYKVYVFCYVPYLLGFALVFLLRTLIWFVSCFTHGLRQDPLYGCSIWLMLSIVFYDLLLKLGMQNIFAPT
ncbi:unnamed protein product [Prunus armeniaca]